MQYWKEYKMMKKKLITRMFSIVLAIMLMGPVTGVSAMAFDNTIRNAEITVSDVLNKVKIDRTNIEKIYLTTSSITTIIYVLFF